jgi:hypothetical protein
MSPKVERRKADGAVRSPIQTPRPVVVPAAPGGGRRLSPERWVVDLLLMTLAALIVGAIALGALALVSTRAPAPTSVSGDFRTCGRPTAEPVAFDACSAPPCCLESR